jgi:hypothetical protein
MPPDVVQIVSVERSMFQMISAVMSFAAGAFAWSGDPVIGFLLGVCVLVWIATTSGTPPVWLTRLRKPTFTVRPE